MSDLDISISEWPNLNVDSVKDVQITKIVPFDIATIHNIAPLAAHIKEVNHIAPITLEPLRVQSVDNISPVRVTEFNVTNLPTVNMSVRQLPAVDLNVRRLPPVSLGFHQDFYLPSSYSVSARLFGFEVMRVSLRGETALIPEEKTRREKRKTQSKSFPQTAVAGNPAIPSRQVEERTRQFLVPGECRLGSAGLPGGFSVGVTPATSGSSSVGS